MRNFTVFLVFLLSSCGAENKDEQNNDQAAANATSETAEPQIIPADVSGIEVTRINVRAPCYQALEECPAEISVFLTGGVDISYSGKSLVATISKTGFPETCDEQSMLGIISVSYKMELGTKYFIRACLFNKQDLTYSPGLTLEYTTESKT